ncbi:MAG: hypothetical protein NUV53_01315 [Patescibacteria group bacterium]|nr:hypothetical protein [Patescibacteria group bacterium]
MHVLEAMSVALLGFLFLVQVWNRKRFPSSVIAVWGIGIVVISGFLIRSSYFIYASWKSDGLGHFFLPPHNSIYYFIRYVIERMWAPWVIACGVGVIVIWVAVRMNRAHGERFFREGEASLAGFCFFSVGYPAFLFYLLAILLVGAIVTAVNHVRGGGRSSLYYWWVPIAVSVIILKVYVIPETMLNFFAL